MSKTTDYFLNTLDRKLARMSPSAALEATIRDYAVVFHNVELGEVQRSRPRHISTYNLSERIHSRIGPIGPDKTSEYPENIDLNEGYVPLPLRKFLSGFCGVTRRWPWRAIFGR